MADRQLASLTRSPSQGKSSVDRATELMQCLAHVRPVGMNDDMASDWLAVAIVEIRNFT